MTEATPFNPQQIYSRQEEALEGIWEVSPNLRSLIYPKSFLLPKGYTHPLRYALSAFSGAISAVRSPNFMTDKTQASIHVTSSLLIRYQVPTWFVGEELCEALMKTEPPQDLLLSEIQWPMPAMLFMLPLRFAVDYFGYEVPWITLCCVEKDAYIETDVRVHGKKVRDVEVRNVDPFLIGTMLCWERGMPMHYDFRSPLTRPVKDLMTAPFEINAPSGLSEHTREQDKKIDEKLINLGLNLLLAMTAEPELVTPEFMIRPANKANGVIRKRALWTPRFLGKSFRVHYEAHSPAGTHRSPHAHWRVGHWRNQRHGPQNTLTKRLWIRPVFVGLVKEK